MTPTSCEFITGVSGVYSIDPDGESGSNPPFDVWCELSLVGGGWTLVGRSALGGSGNFGWKVNTGSVNDTANPYSFNVEDSLLTFSKVLMVATVQPQQAYTVMVPPNFLAMYTTDSFNTTGALTYELGDCMATTPGMLLFMGETNHNGSFFWRNQSMFSGADYGLNPAGFSLLESNCNTGGGLHGKQGAIYVR